jgi:hypothetical protein
MGLRPDEVFRPRRRRRAKPELAVQKAVLRWLRGCGFLVAVTDAGGAYKAGAFFGQGPPAGWPDLTAVSPGGRFVGVECKSKRGRQSDAQKRMQREIENRGGIYVLARSVADVQKALEVHL